MLGIFNLRGGDIPYTPVFTAYAVIGKSSNSQLFVNQSKFEDGLLESINPQGEFFEYLMRNYWNEIV